MFSLITQPVAIAVTFIWIGLVLGISFLEAWLKFRAPGVTTAIGLGIGRLVFGALNKVEWLLAVVVTAMFIARQGLLLAIGNIVLLIIIGILVIQTGWLLPTLDKRAQRVIHNQPVKPSGIHILFIAAELIKVGLLFTMGAALLTDL